MKGKSIFFAFATNVRCIQKRKPSQKTKCSPVCSGLYEELKTEFQNRPIKPPLYPSDTGAIKERGFYKLFYAVVPSCHNKQWIKKLHIRNTPSLINALLYGTFLTTCNATLSCKVLSSGKSRKVYQLYHILQRIWQRSRHRCEASRSKKIAPCNSVFSPLQSRYLGVKKRLLSLVVTIVTWHPVSGYDEDYILTSTT